MKHDSTKINGANPVGEFKRFGQFGPVYQVIEAVRKEGALEDEVKVSVVQTGEQLHYPYHKFLEDPRA